LGQADTTRGPGQQRENKHRLPPGFFDDVAPYVRHWHLTSLFFDLRILSLLDGTAHPYPLHVKIMLSGICLHIDAHSLAASPRTIHMIRQSDRACWSGPGTVSIILQIDEMVQASTRLKTLAQRYVSSLILEGNVFRTRFRSSL
jgi:hypothetical protein